MAATSSTPVRQAEGAAGSGTPGTNDAATSTIILEGYLKKVGKLFNGTKIAGGYAATLPYCLVPINIRKPQNAPTYKIAPCSGGLASKGSLEVECIARPPGQRNLTFSKSVPVMQRWVGAALLVCRMTHCMTIPSVDLAAICIR